MKISCGVKCYRLDQIVYAYLGVLFLPLFATGGFLVLNSNSCLGFDSTLTQATASNGTAYTTTCGTLYGDTNQNCASLDPNDFTSACLSAYNLIPEATYTTTSGRIGIDLMYAGVIVLVILWVMTRCYQSPSTSTLAATIEKNYHCNRLFCCDIRCDDEEGINQAADPAPYTPL